MPFTACKDVGHSTAEKIVTEREENGLFTDFVEAVGRLVNKSIDRGAIESLIHAGAFDLFGLGRYTMLSALDNMIMYANTHKGEISLMSDFDDAPVIEEKKDDKLITAENEKKVLGFYFSFNPLIAVKKKFNIETDNLYNLSVSTGNVKGFGLIQRIKQIKTKKGDPMAFVDLVDDKGSLSLAIMPDLYARCKDELVKGKYALFEGKMERQTSCLVRNIKIF